MIAIKSSSLHRLDSIAEDSNQRLILGDSQKSRTIALVGKIEITGLVLVTR